MNKNIDLTQILKNCPKGWKFYSSIYGEVMFLRIGDDIDYPIRFLFIKKNEKTEGSVTKEGIHNDAYNGECTFFPSKDQRDWSKFTAPWYKKEKFDPKTLQSFDKVIVRDGYREEWLCTIFSNIREGSHPYCTASGRFLRCIPYNDNTKHLIGTTEEAPEYYRYWEN